MSKEATVSHHEHELMGMLLDAYAGRRSGAEASMFMEAMRARIRARLGEIYDACERDVRAAKSDLFNGKDQTSERASARTGK